MSEHPDQTRAYLDEPLAAFTDLLLSKPAASGSAAIPAEDEDLRRLQHTVERLQTAFGSNQPDPAMSGRILRNLHAAWQESQPAARQLSLLERLRGFFVPERKGWRSSQHSQRTQVFRYALAAVAVVVLLLLVVPGTGIGTALTGTAMGEGEWLPFAFLGILFVAVGIWIWRNRSK